NFHAAAPRPLHLAALSRQNFSDVARDLGGLDTPDGDHLFVAARAAISAVQPGAFVLGLAAHLHDESLCRQNRGRRASGAICNDKKSSTDYRTLIPSQIFLTGLPGF